MFDIPVELFLGFVAMSIVVLPIGLKASPRAGMTMFMLGGIFIFTMMALTDNIIMGYEHTQYLIDSQTSSVVATDEIVVYMNVTTADTNQIVLDGSGVTNRYAGERISSVSSALVNKAINCVDIKLLKTGNPTGFFYVGVWSTVVVPSSANYLYLIATVDATTLTTSPVIYSYCNTSDYYTLRFQDTIGVHYASGSTGNTVNVRTTSNNEFDSTSSIRTITSNTAFTDSTTTDVQMAIYGNGFETIETISYETIDGQPINYEFTEMVKFLYAFYGVVLIALGAIVLAKDR